MGLFTPSLLKTSLRDFARRPWQSGLMILGVALGVAVVVAIDLANTSAARAFELSTQAVVGRATHQVLPAASAGLPQSLYRQLRVDWGLRLSAPVVEGIGAAVDLDNQPLRVLGLDPAAEAPFRSYLGAAGGGLGPGWEQLYTEPGAVLIGPGLAAAYGLAPGDPIRFQINGRRVSLRVAGVLQPADAAGRAALDGLLLMDVGAAQRLLGLDGADGRPAALSRIDLILTAAEAQALAQRLPPGARLAPAAAQADAAAQLTAAFQLNLTALSLLALVVGMFLIYNTIMFSVVQRRRVLGVLRSLGVTGEQIFALILAEAGLVALAGGVLGVGLGWLLGQGAVRLVTQTINDLYYVVTVRDAPLEALTVVKGLGLGLAAAWLAAAAPALEAARVPPVTMTQRSAFEDRVRRLLPGLFGAGLALSLAGTALLLGVTDSLLAAFAGLFLIVIGLALAVPQATAGLMALAAPALRRLVGVLGGIAARTVVKAISRTSVAIASLMVAVSVTIGVSVMIASFRATVTNWLDLTLVADLYISAPAAGGGQATISLPADLPARIQAVPGVAAVETIRSVQVGAAGSEAPVSLVVADARTPSTARRYRYANGDPQAIWDQLLAGAVIVSEPYAFRRHLPAQGGSVTLLTDRGPRAFPVAGVYYDYASDQGRVLMVRPVYEQYWDDRGISGVAAYAAPGQDAGRLAEAVRAQLADTAVQVQVNRALRDQALVVFDRTFAITNALRLLAVVVAFIGVLSALLALQLERVRELATLQALGLTPAQLWKLTFLETGLMGLAAGLFSLPTGYVLALVLVYVINLRSFGWTIELQAEPLVYLQAVAVSVAAAVLAAIYPTRRLLQVPVSAALRQD